MRIVFLLLFCLNVVFAHELYAFQFYPMEKEKLDKPVDENHYFFHAVVEETDGFYEYQAALPMDGDSATLLVIPAMPLPEYPSSTYGCYRRQFNEHPEPFQKFCQTKVTMPNEIKDALKEIFDQEYMTVANSRDEGKQGFVFESLINREKKSFSISSFVMELENEKFRLYKQLYTFAKEYLIYVPSQCTKESVTQSLIKKCGAAR